MFKSRLIINALRVWPVITSRNFGFSFPSGALVFRHKCLRELKNVPLVQNVASFKTWKVCIPV